MRIDLREVLAVFLGGAIGALARAEVAVGLAVAPGRWPWATLAVNVAGALMLGVFATRLQERLPPTAYRRPFLGTGVCGGLTTFSTIQLELLWMLDHDRPALALAYAATSLVLGLGAVALTSNLVRRGGLLR